MENKNNELENLILLLGKRICGVKESIQKYTDKHTALANSGSDLFKPFIAGKIRAKKEELYFLDSVKQELLKQPVQPQQSGELLESFMGVTKVQAICCVMANAYRTELNWMAACERVLQQHPGTSYVYMFSLWEAIDAYTNL